MGTSTTLDIRRERVPDKLWALLAIGGHGVWTPRMRPGSIRAVFA